MITQIQGRLIEKTPTDVAIDCNGVGYLLHISLHTYSKLGTGDQCLLYTHLVVREDAHILYGFIDKEERQIFRQLISVSGVGANTARMILSSLSPVEVHQAITDNDVNLLKSIKGIGAKSAQRIIVDLRDKLQKVDTTLPTGSGFSSGSTIKKEALSALIALGFDKSKAEIALDKVMKNNEEDGLSTEKFIKHALRHL